MVTIRKHFLAFIMHFSRIKFVNKLFLMDFKTVVLHILNLLLKIKRIIVGGVVLTLLLRDFFLTLKLYRPVYGTPVAKELNLIKTHAKNTNYISICNLILIKYDDCAILLEFGQTSNSDNKKY